MLGWWLHNCVECVIEDFEIMSYVEFSEARVANSEELARAEGEETFCTQKISLHCVKLRESLKRIVCDPISNTLTIGQVLRFRIHHVTDWPAVLYIVLRRRTGFLWLRPRKKSVAGPC